MIGGLWHDTEYEVVNLDRVARHEVKLGRPLARRFARHWQILVEPEPARIQRLERQVQRHHFGQRGWIGDRVGVHLAEYSAGFDIDNDRFIFPRRVDAVEPMSRMALISRVVPRLGRARAEHNQNCEGTKARAGKKSYRRRLSARCATRTLPEYCHFNPPFPRETVHDQRSRTVIAR